MSTKPQIVIHVTMYVYSSKIDEFWKHLRPLHDAVTAEPECTVMEVSKLSQEDGVTAVHFMEGWNETTDWLGAVG